LAFQKWKALSIHKHNLFETRTLILWNKTFQGAFILP
jgi:hypothetical protein